MICYKVAPVLFIINQYDVVDGLFKILIQCIRYSAPNSCDWLSTEQRAGHVMMCT